jgi:hypothetical protein
MRTGVAFQLPLGVVTYDVCVCGEACLTQYMCPNEARSHTLIH